MEPHDIERVAHSTETNRDNAIGCDHPLAPGFDAVEIASEKPVEIELFDALADRALDECGDPLVEGVIDRGAMSAWYGAPKSFKSFIIGNLGLMVSMGQPWGGRATHKGAVVLVALEGGRGVMKRLRALRDQYPESEGAPLAVLRKSLDLLNRPKDVKFLIDYCSKVAEVTRLPVELVIVDTVARAMAGGDENSGVDMGRFIKNMDHVREETKAHVALVAHSGKDPKKGIRGWSGVLGAIDTEFEITKRTDNTGGIKNTAQRDIDDDVEFRFNRKIATLGEDPSGRAITSIQVEITPASAGAATEPMDLPVEVLLFAEALELRLQEEAGVGEEPVTGHTFKTALANRILLDEAEERSGQKNAHLRIQPTKTILRDAQRLLRTLRESGWIAKSGHGSWTWKK
jgi:hypothetical protein